MSSPLGLSKFILVFIVVVAVLPYQACSLTVQGPLDPFEKYYWEYYGDDSYIVYRGTVLNISDSFSLHVVVKNETGYDAREPLVNASIIIDDAFKVINKDLRTRYERIRRGDNSTLVKVYAWLSGSVVVRRGARLDSIHRIGVKWVVTRFINMTIGNSTMIDVKKYRYLHWFSRAIRIIPRNITGNYTVGDNLLSWAYPTPSGINITLFNPALGIPGPENETCWGRMLPLRPSMLIVYNVSVDITIVSGTRVLYSDCIRVGELYANETLTIPVVLFNSSFWSIPSRLLNVSLSIKCVDDVHGVLVLNRTYLVYYNYTWVNILGAPSTVHIYDGDTGELVGAVNGPWPRRVYLAPFKYYVFSCSGCRDLVLWMGDPINITMHGETSAPVAVNLTRSRSRVDPWSIVKYVVVLATILFVMVLLVERMIREII